MRAANSNAPATPAALRPFLPSDTARLAAIFRAAVHELTGEDYDTDQQEAWAAAADDEAAFGARLSQHLTLVAVRDGETVGFLTLKDNSVIDLFYVAPAVAGSGVGAVLCGAAETLAKARGTKALGVDASDTALGFFQKRGYVPQRRNTVPRGDVWLANTTLTKPLDAAPEIVS
ncbi:GNAT family N-acetyltransferase [Aquabacter spiritensis]|uniref:GNAT family acetyltransferase n=1 Tax=Aquabacter spiritensis TaxID=933073 RepID=A0A4V2UXE7_9HYPH|nr:GNAT family N-acetyltransferase [Aquabacter spiritensis]TCT03198.1 GNAT family acetyltransferase [Aquabacter spiritensis]